MLKDNIFRKDLIGQIKKKESFSPYPTIDDRNAWNRVDVQLRESIMSRANDYLDKLWPQIKLTHFIDYFKSGSRLENDSRAQSRRSILTYFVLAECLENKGVYMDAIIDGIWSICEQSTWIIPAHIHQTHRTRDAIVPDVEDVLIDLYVGEMGALLAFTHYLLKSKLDKISPNISKRIHYELKRRIITPFVNRIDYWWMGYDKETNNWAPWCVSNILAVVMLIEDDEDIRLETVYKSLAILDHFLNTYSEDGGCEEGATYWNRAAASLYECLALLDDVSYGKLHYFDQVKIRNMSLYAYYMHIADNAYVNFADGKPIVKCNPELFYRIGKAINREGLCAFAKWSLEYNGYGMIHDIGHHSIMRLLPFLFNYNDIMKIEDEYEHEKHVWLEGIQVMVARESTLAGNGLVLAAKGGHNGESHNHNDLGHFTVYSDGNPVLIDIGAGTYTRQTFGPGRYSIFTMQSDYHNVPMINGISQINGQDYFTRTIRCDKADNHSLLELDMDRVMPQDAKVQGWKRTFELNNTNKTYIKIVDQLVLENAGKDVIFHYITSYEPNLATPGQIILQDVSGQYICMAYDYGQFEVDYEMFTLKDEKLIGSWGERLYRLKLRPLIAKKTIDLTLIINKIESRKT